MIEVDQSTWALTNHGSAETFKMRYKPFLYQARMADRISADIK